MVFTFVFKLKMKNSEKGITLIEIMVTIAIITLFSMILIADYPKIKRQFALSRAVYKFAQDLRKTQDMGLSGVQIKDENQVVVEAEGYGIYININLSSSDGNNKQYKIYADINGNGKYNSEGDYVIKTVDFGETEKGVIIQEIINTKNNAPSVSINFSPPNPDIEIWQLESNRNNVEIVFALSSDPTNKRKVSVNTSGLIEVK